jgi:hypothetical protein
MLGISSVVGRVRFAMSLVGWLRSAGWRCRSASALLLVLLLVGAFWWCPISDDVSGTRLYSSSRIGWCLLVLSVRESDDDMVQGKVWVCERMRWRMESVLLVVVGRMNHNGWYVRLHHIWLALNTLCQYLTASLLCERASRFSTSASTPLLCYWTGSAQFWNSHMYVATTCACSDRTAFDMI